MYYFSANHNSRCYLIFFQPIILLCFILFVPFIQSHCKSLCEIIGSNSLQMFVYLFLLGFLRTLLPFWYVWVYICYKLQYCSLFSLFSYFLNSVKKSVCTWTRKKNITFWGFLFLVFSFYNHCIYTGEIFVPFYFRPFHSFPPRCHAAGKFNYLRAVSSDPTGTFTKTHQEF